MVNISVVVESLSTESLETNTPITVACDNEKAIQKVRIQKHRLQRNMASIDVTSEIEILWSSSSVNPI